MFPRTVFSGLLLVVILSLTTVTRADTRVFLLGGQSNMVGQGTSAELTPPYDTPQTDVNFWNNGWIPLRPGFGNNGGAFGPEVSFGRAIKDAYPGDDIYLVKYAVGGTALYNDWAPTTGPQYNGFISTVNAALTNLSTNGVDYQLSAMLWMQGESDALENQAAAYETNLRNFIDHMRDRLATPNLPFIMGRVLDYYGGASGQADIVRAAQVTVATDTDNVEWFDTDSYSVVDPASNPGHYGTQGILDMGLDFAANYHPVEPPHLQVVVDVESGEVWLDGLYRSASGIQIYSAANSLNPTDFTPDVLQFVIQTNTETYAEGAFTDMPIDGMISLGTLYNPLVDARDLTFDYTLLNLPTFHGQVIYIPEPASLVVLLAGTLLLRRRLGRS